MKIVQFIAENGSTIFGVEVPKDAITFSIEMEDYPQLSYYSKRPPESEGKSIDPMVCTIPKMGKAYGTFNTKTNKFNFKVPDEWVKKGIPLDGYYDPEIIDGCYPECLQLTQKDRENGIFACINLAN